ncbi:MAG TPA: isoleucine--tRNA ligase [Tepidisphaeraceae bacterium]|jgi:isoleucyl-tRNA synthetase|nr:isoleucine--tRNA ligase [Tepidisphaeraceae bacterium]
MTQAAEKIDYKQTLNLPRTEFAMKADLVNNEPKRLAKWKAQKLYEQIERARAASGSAKWILHDGPPFANGDIHIGHLINKTLKDVFVRFHSMEGYSAPYVPGWDCHGLPIEHKVQEELVKKGLKPREMSVVEIRKQCYAWAAKYAPAQSEQFQRLGILGDWDRPYLTMSPEYEAKTLDAFASFVERGIVYKQLKPVHWSIVNQTALADAELEYQDIDGPSIFVEFKAIQPKALFARLNRPEEDVYLLVWTTTPWTLAANLAVAINPGVDYCFVEYEHEGPPGRRRIGLVAEALVGKVFTGRAGIKRHEILAKIGGAELVETNIRYQHPFVNRQGRILPAEYVTTTDGTGLVHTAPGHGEDDYSLGQKFGLDIYCPVLANGRYDNTVPDWLVGKTVWEADPLVIERLRELGVLLASETIRHSYPHDWRSKTPTIFRATEQWFVSVDKEFAVPGAPAGERPQSLRARAIEALGNVDFIPGWGKNRIQGMLESRPDWCISRQRAWGLPIPVFYNEKGDALLTPESVRAVGKAFAHKGSDAWFTDSPAELLGDYDPGPRFGKDSLRKEKDIFDVWFESGSSWHGVLQQRPELRYPADLYLEGSDQHRGWFQLSLLVSLAVTGKSPFEQVLTHGFIVKPDGTKVSKSDKEYVTATQEVNRHGADLLRLWSCSVDYQGDIPTSPAAIAEFGEKYKKIRNTLRFLLANLYDFDPAVNGVEVSPHSLDGWAMAETDVLIRDVLVAYDAYQTHRAFRLLYDFCSVQISAIYGNAMKDRLYCELPNSPLRRRIQTVMHRMLVVLTKLLAPMLVFTADEVWEQILHKPAEDAGLWSVHLARLPTTAPLGPTAAVKEEWKLLFTMRDQGLAQLDKLTRQVVEEQKQQGQKSGYKSVDAEIIYRVDDETRRKLEPYGADLEDVVGAGYHSFAAPAGGPPTVELVDRRGKYSACARSWKRRPDVGRDPQFPDLSARDAAALRTLRGS